MTEVLWNRMTAEELRQKAADNAIVLLPVASTEQHGPHLATGVDTFLGGEACCQTGRGAGADGGGLECVRCRSGFAPRS